MIGFGTLVNAISIIAGAFLGLLARDRLSHKIRDLVIQGMALITLAAGFKMFLETKEFLVVVFSILFGILLGHRLRIEKKLEDLAHRLKMKMGSKEPTFIEGFITTSLLYCTGPMAILGPIEDAIQHQYGILFLKSILDGVTAIAFAASLGVGVVLSALSVLIYQGIFTLGASLAGNFFSQPMMNELTATGGVLLIAIGLNLLKITEKEKAIPLGDFLPSLFFAPIFACFALWIGGGLS